MFKEEMRLGGVKV